MYIYIYIHIYIVYIYTHFYSPCFWCYLNLANLVNLLKLPISSAKGMLNAH